MYDNVNSLYAPQLSQSTRQKRPNIIARMFAALDNWYDRRRAIRTLEGYSDRLLADIGLYRGQIAQFVDGTDKTTTRKLIPLRAEPEDHLLGERTNFLHYKL